MTAAGLPAILAPTGGHARDRPWALVARSIWKSGTGGRRTARGNVDGEALGPETSDEELMLAFQAGDARAFEALVRRHRTPVYNFILRFAGQRARAEDLLQEAWLKVVRSAPE